jgi:hypothetical protein
MSKFGCTCGHTIVDQTDFLPYKAHIREDEDTQKPIELLAETLSQFWEARQQGQEAEFVRQFELSHGATEGFAELLVRDLAKKPLTEVLYDFIFPFWNNHDRTIYECEECGRLWVHMENGYFAPFLPETDARHVLWSRHNHNPYGYLDE